MFSNGQRWKDHVRMMRQMDFRSFGMKRERINTVLPR
jgi:hypothetical protein